MKIICKTAVIFVFAAWSVIFAQNIENKFGHSSDIFAYVANGDLESSMMWLFLGNHVNTQDKFGNSPLFIAAEDGYTDIIELFISRGANVNLSNKYGYTPIFSAVVNNHPEAAAILIDAGARIDIKTAYDLTLSEYLTTQGYTSINQFIAKKNNKPSKKGPNSAMYLPPWLKQADKFFAENKIEEGINLLNAAAVTEPYAQYLSAKFYMGSGYKSIGLKYLKQAADSGFLPAVKALGVYYLGSSNIDDHTIGYEYAKSAADAGHVGAMVLLGECLIAGDGTRLDYDQSYEYFFNAGKWKSSDGLYYAGIQEYYGFGVKQDNRTGLKKILDASKGGSSLASQQLKRMATEKVLAGLPEILLQSKAHMNTYLFSQGAVAESTNKVNCDNYNVSSFMQADYGIHNIMVCTDNHNPDKLSNKSFVFNVNNDILPEYKEYLRNYSLKVPVKIIYDGKK